METITAGATFSCWHVTFRNWDSFSTNPLTGLPQAVKGQRATEDTFVLESDLVGGINYYRRHLKISNEWDTLKEILTEWTVNYFKQLAEEMGIPYQTLINLYLRDCAVSNKKPLMQWKTV